MQQRTRIAAPSRRISDAQAAATYGIEAAPSLAAGQGLTRQPAPRPLGQIYTTVGGGRRTLNWPVSNRGPNAALEGSLQLLRDQSRDQDRKNPHARRGLNTFAANAIGSGITPTPLIPEDLGGETTKTTILDLWGDWILDADAAGRFDYYGMEWLGTRTLRGAGEVLIRRRLRYPDDGLDVPLQLQMLEPDLLDAAYTTLAPNGNRILNGIELDGIGRRTAYWMWRVHPGENQLGEFQERVRVPASEILHVYQPLRPGQMRGEPSFAPVLSTLYELDQYEDAELVRKKIAAMFAAFITTPLDADTTPPVSADNEDPLGASADDTTVTLNPGTINFLEPGEQVQFAAPADVGANFDHFMRRGLLRVAAGAGVTYEQLTGDLTNVNFSSMRVGLLEFRREMQAFQQQIIVFQFCRPVWAWFMDAAVLARALPIKPADYAANRRRYLRAKWTGHGWDWVDPLKDVQAAILSVRAGFEPRTDIVAAGGRDSDAVDRQTAIDNERADRLGNIYDSDPRKTNAKGVAQPDSSVVGAEDAVADPAEAAAIAKGEAA